MTPQPPAPDPTPSPPAVPVRTPAPWKLIGLITGGAVALCGGGVTLIDSYAGRQPMKRPAAAPTWAVPSDSAAPQPSASAPATESTFEPTVGAITEGTSPPGSVPARSPSNARTFTVAPRPAPVTRQPSAPPTTNAPSPEPTSKGPATPTKTPTKQVHYKNCAAVRAAGAAPIYRGDPGYGRHLDRDGDGVGCETG